MNNNIKLKINYLKKIEIIKLYICKKKRIFK